MKILSGVVLAVLALVPSFLLAQTLNFSVASATTGGATLTPRLTWSTTPAATSCTASGGSSGWAGVKGPSGVQTLTPISQSETYTLVCSWPSTTGSFQPPLTWVNPTHNDNGTPDPNDGDLYTDPKGTIIAYGASAGTLSQSQLVDSPTATTAPVTNVPAGTYYVCVKAISTSDRQSLCSNIVTRVVTPDPIKTINRTAGLVFVKPNAPTGLQ